MRAMVLEHFGKGPGLKEIPLPRPGAGEVALRIAACGLNFADLLTIEGRYQEKPRLPATLGMEVSGVVTAHGPGVAAPPLGSRVAVFAGSGGLAEHGVFPAGACVPLPEVMGDVDAAAFLIAYGTAHLALVHRAALRPGETVLVLGAAGGVGLTAVEIAHRLGARVIAVARGAERLAVARDAGADETIDSGEITGEALRTALKATGGVDVVFDAVGEPLFSAALRACRPEARYLLIGFAGGRVPQIPANLLLVKNVTVIGLYWGGYARFAPEVMAGSLRELMGWYEAGGLRPHVSHVLPLERAPEGFDLLRQRAATGKIVVTMGGPPA